VLYNVLLIFKERPSKTDSIFIRGDGYKFRSLFRVNVKTSHSVRIGPSGSRGRRGRW